MTDQFRPHPRQVAFMEGGARRMMLIPPRHAGRRLAIEATIVANAADVEQARLALEDLERHGVALQDASGMRVDPKPDTRARWRYAKFDEEERR